MGDPNVTSNVKGDTARNLVNTTREPTLIYNGEKPEGFSDWQKITGFILSTQRPDVFAATEGQATSIRQMKQMARVRTGRVREFISCTTVHTRVTVHTWGDPRTTPNCILQGLFAILHLAKNNKVAWLADTHADDERGTRGDGQKAVKELENKRCKVTNETIYDFQAALMATTMDSGRRLRPLHHHAQERRLRSRLAIMGAGTRHRT